jgi:hypothetical protein
MLELTTITSGTATISVVSTVMMTAPTAGPVLRRTRT